MEGLATVDAVFLALTFIVPGFVFNSARIQFITGRDRKTELPIIRYLSYSAVNYAVFSAPIYFFVTADLPLGWKAAGWTCVILIGPTLLGVLAGVSNQKDWLFDLLQWAGLNPVHGVPTAWDWKLARSPSGAWVLATLKDGSEVAGYFGKRSFASSEPDERDLYLEQLYEVDDTGQWTRSDQGVLIAAGEIMTVEFWPVGQQQEGETKNE